MDVKADKRTWLTAAACAARTGLTVRALRVYERDGLLNPTRGANGWRRYGPADLVRLNSIVILKVLGLTLAQIRAIMSDHPPSLLQLLDIQANVWKEKLAGAQRALACVDAASRRLHHRHDLSVDNLCSLLKTLDDNWSKGMNNTAFIMRDLINELITPDEERAWITWWTKHPEDATATKVFNEEQNALFLRARGLSDQGVDPASPEAQKLLAEHDAILLRNRVRERTVRLLDWNSSVAYKFYALGAEARSRRAKDASGDGQPPAILAQSVADFLAAARKASPRTFIVKQILSDARAHLDRHTDPAAGETDDVVRRWRQLCSEHLLGDPYDAARCAPFLGRVNRVDTAELYEPEWEFLARAILLRNATSTGSRSDGALG
jgi:DNA-binding transcriptional MerR regulator